MASVMRSFGEHSARFCWVCAAKKLGSQNTIRICMEAYVKDEALAGNESYVVKTCNCNRSWPALRSSHHHCEAIQSSNPIKLEILTTNGLMDSSQELNKDLVSHTSPSDLIPSSSPLTSTLAVVAPSTQLCNPAFEHDQTKTGMSMYPGKEAIPKQDSKTENFTRLHERSPKVSADSSPVVFIQRARRTQGEMGTEKGSAR